MKENDSSERRRWRWRWLLRASVRHPQVLTLGWREDIRVGDPMHTRKVCFDAVSHNSPVTLYDCHGMKGNQLWRYRKVCAPVVLWNCAGTTIV